MSGITSRPSPSKTAVVGPKELTGMVDPSRDSKGRTRARLLDLVPGWSGPPTRSGSMPATRPSALASKSPAEPHDVERVEHDGVLELVVEGVLIAVERIESAGRRRGSSAGSSPSGASPSPSSVSTCASTPRTSTLSSRPDASHRRCRPLSRSAATRHGSQDCVAPPVSPEPWVEPPGRKDDRGPNVGYKTVNRGRIAAHEGERQDLAGETRGARIPYSIRDFAQRVARIELAPSAWEAASALKRSSRAGIGRDGPGSGRPLTQVSQCT